MKIIPDKVLQVRVTQADIDSSPRFGTTKCYTCPVYRALERQLGRHIAVFETQTGAFNLVEGDMLYKYNHDGFEFIKAFDEGESVHPSVITFTLVE